MANRKAKARGHKYERDAVASILEYAENRPRLTLWRQAVIRTKIRGKWVQAGALGQPDLTGVLRSPFGALRIDVEVKSLTGDLRDSQKKYRRRIREAYGIYIVARTPADVAAVIDPIERRLWQLEECRGDRAIIESLFQDQLELDTRPRSRSGGRRS
jgi:hypothetical protein